MARDHSPGLTAAEGRKFGLTLGIAFVAVGAIVAWRGHAPAAAVLCGIGGALLAAAVLLPSRLGPVQRAWMGLAHAISRVTTPIFMSLVYVLVLTPVGFLRRNLARNPLRHPAGDGGYWVRPRPEHRTGMERQF